MAAALHYARLIPLALRVTLAGGATYGTVKAGAWSDAKESRERLEQFQQSARREVEYPPLPETAGEQNKSKFGEVLHEYRPTSTFDPKLLSFWVVMNSIARGNSPYVLAPSRLTSECCERGAPTKGKSLAVKSGELSSLRTTLVHTWNSGIRSLCHSLASDRPLFNSVNLSESWKKVTTKIKQWTDKT